MAQYLDLDGLKTLVTNINNKFIKKGEIDNTFVEVVTNLPTTNIKKHIYLVPESAASGVNQNKYVEYVYTGTLPINVDGTTHASNYDATKWEKLGDFQAEVDLSNYATIAALNNKVDKVSGKGLSTNDFTSAYKTKLDGIATGATNITVDSTLNSTSTNPVQNKVVNTALNSKVSTTTFNELKTNYDNLEFSPDTPFSTAENGQQFIGLAFGDNNTHDNKSNVEIYTATQTKPGIMSTSDKKKLDNITNIKKSEIDNLFT